MNKKEYRSSSLNCYVCITTLYSSSILRAHSINIYICSMCACDGSRDASATAIAQNRFYIHNFNTETLHMHTFITEPIHELSILVERKRQRRASSMPMNYLLVYSHTWHVSVYCAIRLLWWWQMGVWLWAELAPWPFRRIGRHASIVSIAVRRSTTQMVNSKHTIFLVSIAGSTPLFVLCSNRTYFTIWCSMDLFFTIAPLWSVSLRLPSDYRQKKKTWADYKHIHK